MIRKYKNRKDNGWSMIEIMVVLALAAIISLIAIVSLSNIRKGNVDDRTRADVNAVGSAFNAVSFRLTGTTGHTIVRDGDSPLVTVGIDLNGNGTLDDGEPQQKVNEIDKNTMFNVERDGGGFKLVGWNPAGRSFTSESSAYVFGE